jgi:hypothetical protein
MTTCLFCENPANSKEHLWPQWILKQVQTRESVRRTIGSAQPVVTANREVEVRSVCVNCNTGWMSALEVESKPLLGSMVDDIILNLDVSLQTSAALWATKTAMVVDSVKRRGRFYLKSECESLRTKRDIPPGTKIWMGRYFGRSLNASGTDITFDANQVAKIIDGSVITILIGHLIFQVLTLHARPEFSGQSVTVSPNAGRWDELLAPIWPISSNSVSCPPRLSFTSYGSFPFASLLLRWKRQS